MDRELLGHVVIVTGAGRGIGRAVVVELAAAGARLVLVARTRTDLERAAEEIGAHVPMWSIGLV
jgi:NAD(P)-dependent dehydrogenase (short-subunit alcohol dehydrogenase family)